ncbi:hypothetical protein FIBSPDRAFT_933972 [Athelia psychrophila]|uniref:Biotin carboxylation domain-containing protein n=1 Tax=Athelia psychrophila TaxID=1759441 RepID=A0A166G9N6_9AGAM|nr:hypothetical protein FIBSPDRAFT_933972 [Fibularhizoctonia sp. CBS 109695]
MPSELESVTGQFAICIIRTAKELVWSTVAIYTARDTNAAFADEAVKLDDVFWFIPERIVDIAKRTQSTDIYPGYGFPSEGFALTSLLSTPTLGRPNGSPRPTLTPGTHVKLALHVRAFVRNGVRYPAVIKAVGGCMDENPSGPVFFENALSGPGWKHLEGDATGDLAYLCELQCSVRWRFQKVVEICTNGAFHHPRNLVESLLAASTEMARALRYQGAATFEYLVHSHTGEPRSGLQQSLTGLCRTFAPHCRRPPFLRRNFNHPCLAPIWAAGRGTDFDSKIMVRWRDLEDVTQRAVRALRETSIGNDDEEAGVETDERLVAHSYWEGRAGAGVCAADWDRGAQAQIAPGLDVEKVPLASGSGLRATQAGTIFHIALSAPGSNLDPKPPQVRRSTLPSRTAPFPHSDTLQSIFLLFPLVFSVKRGLFSAVVAAGASDLVDACRGGAEGEDCLAKGDTIAVSSMRQMQHGARAPHGKGADVELIDLNAWTIFQTLRLRTIILLLSVRPDSATSLYGCVVADHLVVSKSESRRP